MMDVDEITEELTVQRVLLSSIEDDHSDGVEEERAELRAGIARLKALLAQAMRQDRALSHQDRHAADDDEVGSEDQGTQPAHDRRRESQPGTPRQPARANDRERERSHSRIMTPMRETTAREPGSVSLPSRKREFDTTGLQNDDQSGKSRRIPPESSGYHPFSSPSHARITNFENLDFIDLTADDDAEDDEFNIVEQQFLAERRREQERADRELAIQLSARHSPDPPHTTMSSQGNALNRLMETQQRNSGPIQSFAPSQQATSSSQTGSSPQNSQWTQPTTLAAQMPGAYDASWDQPHYIGSGDPSSVAGGSVPAIVSSRSAQATFPTTNYHSHPLMVAPSAYLPTTSFNQQLPGFPHGGIEAQSFGRAPHFPGFTPSHGGGALSQIINRTSGYDLTNGVDGLGNPLPDRLTDYLTDVMFDTRVSEKELEDLLQNIRPDMEIPEKNREGTPAGLRSTLYLHQELALSWLKSMEDGNSKGGILADDMGLGKTISTLALMLSRPAEARPKTNLIIGPLSLMRQWEEEIHKKVLPSHRMSVFVYHNKKTTSDELLKYDVVLTTYGTLAQELKRLSKFMEDNAGRNIDYSDRTFCLQCPLLHPKKAVFHRVILDEAQCIKNKLTQTAKACCKLKATYRWCLTGTPMMNNVSELYSLLQFLNIKPYCQWEHFKQSFGTLFGKRGDSRSIAMKRLRTLLKAVMLRRKKDSELDGKPILRLPPKTEEVIHATLSPEERDFYAQLEKKSQVLFNKYLRDNSIGKNYSNILVLLLRMRQACCHPHLNLDVEDATPVTDDDILRLVKELDPIIVNRIKEIEAFECPICYDVVQSPSFFIPCGHDSCRQCLSQLVDNAARLNIQEGNESNKAKCPVCRGAFEPAKCFSYEAFQKVHMSEEVETSGSDDEDADSDTDPDSGDDSDFADEDDEEVDKRGNLKGFIVTDEDADGESDGKAIEKARKKKKTRKGKGKARAKDVRPSTLKSLRKEANKSRHAYKTYMAYLRKTWLPSGKVSECMRLLKSIQETGEKTIIFSQWTLLLDLIEVAMYHEGFDRKPERYDGSMSSTERNNAAHAFRDKEQVKVLLVSLRAGNAGLNLTSASRVIILDPFWNPYIEMQAIDRAYRIGQQREVKVYRILTEETVEDRIVELQEKKKEIVEAALDEAEGRKIGRLSTSELKYLFYGKS